MIIDDEILCKKYSLNIEDFKDCNIDFDALKIRTSNCLKKEGILQIDRLLSMSYSKLLGIQHMGILSLEDIEKYVLGLSCALDNSYNVSYGSISNKIKDKKDLIFKGEFIDELYDGLTDKEIEIINERFKVGFKLLDKEMIRLCREKTASMYEILEMLGNFVKQTEQYDELCKLYDSLNEKKQNMLKPYFEIYPLKKELGVDFARYCENSDATVESIFDKSIIGNFSIKEEIKFAKWLSYNLRDELDVFLKGIYSKKSVNVKRILELRAKKLTLQEIGNEFRITRERVRQIEKSVVEPFCHWQKVKKFLPRLSADFNGKTIFGPIDLQEYFGDMTEILLYLLQCADDEFFSYDRETDTVIIVSDDITDFSRNFVEKMPDELELEDVEEYRKKAIEEYDIPIYIFDREVLKQYNLSGTHYHRNKLSLEKIYQIILKKYYPNGMNIYEEKEIERFRSLIVNEFGDISLPQKNRAISASIGRSCMLCGRGKYKVKDNKTIPHALVEKVYNYIVNSDRSLFFMNEIYIEFEEELCDAGIDNRFFLQGVLRAEYENELFFRRDYVSKNSENLSMYREIQLFVKKSKYPVTKEQIRSAYPGITEIMVSIALSDDDILNYFGTYIHSSNLNIFDYDKKYIQKITQQILHDNMPHHCNEIFEFIKIDNLDMLNRLGIYYQYSLFSLIQYLYHDDFEFERPYIAQKGVNINNPIEFLQEYITANEVFQITEFIGLAREYHYAVYDILKFLNSWNDTHLLINKHEMASVEFIGITAEIVDKIEKMIVEELDESSLIADLKCIYKLPKLNVPWDEWLVYSAIKRWGKILEVNTTSNQFRTSFPVVSKKGMFNRNSYEGIESGEMVKTIDLNDLDAVGEYIMEDFKIEW